MAPVDSSAKEAPVVVGHSLTSKISFISRNRTQEYERTIYQYESLDDAEYDVRLLTLLPGEPSAGLRVRLRNVPFNTQHPPPCEALSYTWGSTEDLAFVAMGESGNATTTITQNLAAALLHLRYSDRPRVLWIDAICVNQMDTEERSKQVRSMGVIYRLAHRVIAWVGVEADESSTALEILKVIDNSIEVDWSRFILKPAVSNEESKRWHNFTRTGLLADERKTTQGYQVFHLSLMV